MDEKGRLIEKRWPGGCIKYGSRFDKDRFSCELEWAEYCGEKLTELVFGKREKPEVIMEPGCRHKDPDHGICCILKAGHEGPHGLDDGTTWPQTCEHVFDDGKCLLCGLDLEYTHEIKR